MRRNYSPKELPISMKTPRKILLLMMLGIVGSNAWAQIPGANIPPRSDDHFQRNLVVNRIDLDEKMNQAIISTQDPALYGQAQYGQTQGLIIALLQGLKRGQFLAYDSDNLGNALTYEEVALMGEKINGEELINDTYDPEYAFEPEENGGELDEQAGSGASSNPFSFEVSPFETAIEFIENRIFDKNRSAEIYDIQYIRLVWVDPGETLPDKNFICFKFSDVLETLEDTQWKNRFNDAEYRNLREVFEMRLFNGFITHVSGRGVRTIEESAFRQRQMLDFEHQLWSF